MKYLIVLSCLFFPNHILFRCKGKKIWLKAQKERRGIFISLGRAFFFPPEENEKLVKSS
jgi:hypothetical protein